MPLLGTRAGASVRGYGLMSAPAPLIIDYLVIAGGGGGGSVGGGGGAGGFRTSYGTSGRNSSAESVFSANFSTNYNVTIGAGGTGVKFGPSTNGGNSTFATITSTGGGCGGGNQAGSVNGGNGGCGGGARSDISGSTAGTGATAQGFDGSRSIYGGGGGAGAAGATGTGAAGSAGGNGIASTIIGSSVTYAGGGGSVSETTPAAGGSGGGGTGGVYPNAGTNGGTNLGGGGGGGGDAVAPNNGGSGVVILRYPNTSTITIGAGLTGSTTTSGSDKITTITAGTGNVSWA